jgi:hypothetical protein
MRDEGDTDPNPPIHPHAHNAALHVAATTGIVGLMLGGGVIALALIGGVRKNPVASAPGSEEPARRWWEGWDGGMGPVFGIAGLMLAGLFDPVHLNTQTGALLAAFLAMCTVSRPVERPVP